MTTDKLLEELDRLESKNALTDYEVARAQEIEAILDHRTSGVNNG